MNVGDHTLFLIFFEEQTYINAIGVRLVNVENKFLM